MNKYSKTIQPNGLSRLSSSKGGSLKQAELQVQQHVSGSHEGSEMSHEKPLVGKQFQEQPEHKDQSQERPAATGTESMELCWYCMKSHSLAEHNTPQLMLENKASVAPYGGYRLSYQQDPRPHFGVAHSSRSTSFPLWGSEGHGEMKSETNEDDINSISNCPHCHLGLPLDTLRWHAEKCLLFEGPKNDI